MSPFLLLPLRLLFADVALSYLGPWLWLPVGASTLTTRTGQATHGGLAALQELVRQVVPPQEDAFAVGIFRPGCQARLPGPCANLC